MSTLTMIIARNQSLSRANPIHTTPTHSHAHSHSHTHTHPHSHSALHLNFYIGFALTYCRAKQILCPLQAVPDRRHADGPWGRVYHTRDYRCSLDASCQSPSHGRCALRVVRMWFLVRLRPFCCCFSYCFISQLLLRLF